LPNLENTTNSVRLQGIVEITGDYFILTKNE
jgi:hypothetical protein